MAETTGSKLVRADTLLHLAIAQAHSQHAAALEKIRVEMEAEEPEPEPPPPPPPPPAGDTPDNTTVKGPDGVIRIGGVVWSFGEAFGNGWRTLRDGVHVSDGSGSEYYLLDGQVYTFGTDANWYRWDNGWRLVGGTKPSHFDPPVPEEPPPPPVPLDPSLQSWMRRLGVGAIYAQQSGMASDPSTFGTRDGNAIKLDIESGRTVEWDVEQSE